MSDFFQTGFNVVVGVLMTIFGWLLNTLYTTIRDLQQADEKLTDKVNRVEVLVAGNYPTRGEFDSKIDALFKKLDNIENKLDRKADR
jgi:hypothetical protein